MATLAPIIFFAYKRPDIARKALESLALNPEAAESELYVFADGPKEGATAETLQQIAATREVIRSRQWCGTVHIAERVQNYGLAKSVITGVTEVIEKHGKAIIVEDDLVLSPYFLRYMNEGLDLYEDEPQVASLHGYVYPVQEKLPETFFIRGADCWGWATWARAWKQFEADGQKLYDAIRLKGESRAFDFNNTYDYMKMLRKQISGQNDSWAIRWYASAFLKNMLTLYPSRSLVQNIGGDESATHMDEADAEKFEVVLSPTPVQLQKIPIEASVQGTTAFEDYFRSNRLGFVQRIKRFIKNR
ncbi:glycosyltransferase family 2 protein [Chitinophaga qingshengii]|uniref:Glycosyltransferase family 2 protein n=1 Tax=Chitinophaga qingshengii TaxID=1569794 RepID=A0ABR7TYT8_9BACT|nr:glycosyltransferase family 2 protein [Chitinophaga qingshengii]MBC9934389.1 glycosyltransferase family 2 protein [Chitinophaga qingshengii]